MLEVEVVMVGVIILVLGCLGVTTLGAWWMLRKTQNMK